MDVLSRSLAVLVLACAVAAGTVGSTASSAGARRRLHARVGLGHATRRLRVPDDLTRQLPPREPRAQAARRFLGVAGIGRLEGPAHGEVRLHGAQRSGSAGCPQHGRADGRVRGLRRLGREHRRGLPDACSSRQRLAQLSRPPCEHRERELCRDRLRRGGERLGPDLLGAHVLEQRWGLGPAASAGTRARAARTAAARSTADDAQAARAGATRAGAAPATGPARVTASRAKSRLGRQPAHLHGR